jgi:apolipoprotein N-acyltransferase
VARACAVGASSLRLPLNVNAKHRSRVVVGAAWGYCGRCFGCVAWWSCPHCAGGLLLLLLPLLVLLLLVLPLLLLLLPLLVRVVVRLCAVDCSVQQRSSLMRSLV